jgi:hypothetical protein
VRWGLAPTGRTIDQATSKGGGSRSEFGDEAGHTRHQSCIRTQDAEGTSPRAMDDVRMIG